MNPTSSKVERRALTLTLDLAEADDCRNSNIALSTHFGDAAGRLMELGVIKADGQVSSVETRDGGLATVVWSPERRGFGFFSEEDGWVDLHHDEVGAFSLQIKELLRTLTANLEMQPTGTFVELRQGLLWDIGSARLPAHTKRVSIWVARRFHDPDVWEGLRKAALIRPTLDHRLVFSLSNAELPNPILANHTVASVASLVSVTNPLEIDPEIASARLRRPVGKSEPVMLSAEGAHLLVHGREYLFKGLRQRAIVRRSTKLWKMATHDYSRRTFSQRRVVDFPFDASPMSSKTIRTGMK